MSAFMLSNESFQQIADFLATPPTMHEEPLAWVIRPNGLPRWEANPRNRAEAAALAVRIVHDWRLANVRAIAGRYGERGRDMGVESMVLRKPKPGIATLSTVAMVKRLHCLGYQCAEDVDPAHLVDHERFCEEMKTAACLLASRAISGLPEYNAAEWG